MCLNTRNKTTNATVKEKKMKEKTNRDFSKRPCTSSSTSKKRQNHTQIDNSFPLQSDNSRKKTNTGHLLAPPDVAWQLGWSGHGDWCKDTDPHRAGAKCPVLGARIILWCKS